jgi:hypothetical protein
MINPFPLAKKLFKEYSTPNERWEDITDKEKLYWIQQALHDYYDDKEDE